MVETLQLQCTKILRSSREESRPKVLLAPLGKTTFMTLKTNMTNRVSAKSLFLAIALVYSMGTHGLAQTGAPTAIGLSGSFAPTTIDAAPASPAIQSAPSPTANQFKLAQPSLAQTAAEVPTADVEVSRPPQRLSGPNQFQRFVQESTGQLLPAYGHDLFNNPYVVKG
jgi:hypothetical protein